MVLCKKCKATFDEDFIVEKVTRSKPTADNRSAEITTTPVCPHCGSTNIIEVDYCETCGKLTPVGHLDEYAGECAACIKKSITAIRAREHLADINELSADMDGWKLKDYRAYIMLQPRKYKEWLVAKEIMEEVDATTDGNVTDSNDATTDGNDVTADNEELVDVRE